MTIDTCQIHQYTELDGDGECPTCKALGSSPCSACECSQWADVRSEYRMLTGHHENCPRRPDPLEKALDLIANLAHGMECWAADEDGIHPDAWEAYRQAKGLEGVFLEPNNLDLGDLMRLWKQVKDNTRQKLPT